MVQEFDEINNQSIIEGKQYFILFQSSNMRRKSKRKRERERIKKKENIVRILFK